MTAESGLRIDGYAKAFGDQVVLHDFTLTVEQGEFIAIVGKSGCGKSTLLKSIAGFDDQYAGRVEYAGGVGFGFQDARYLPWRRVWQNVVLGERGRRADLRAKAVEQLGRVGLSHRADAWPSTLSGGEAQRMALARALAKEPALLLLDEPFGALDALTRVRAQALVANLWAEYRFTCLLVTHDVEEAISLADRIVVIHDGSIAEIIAVPLARPRRRDDPRFEQIRVRILHELGVLDRDGNPIAVDVAAV